MARPSWNEIEIRGRVRLWLHGFSLASAYRLM
jgi:hypothetical protein